MPEGVLFITAPSVDYKAANRFFVSLQSWSNNEELHWFHMMQTKNAYEIDFPDGNYPLHVAGEFTAKNFQNAWAGSSLEDIESFARDTIQHNAAHGQPHLFLILDEQGLHDKTCILAETHTYHLLGPDGNGEPQEPPYFFNKVRLPWNQALNIWVNLDISKIGFDDVCDSAREPDENGWRLYRQKGNGIDRDADKREETLARLVEEGKVLG